MAKKPSGSILSLIEEWESAWMHVQQFKMNRIGNAMLGKGVALDLGESEAKEKLRGITSQLRVWGAPRGIDVSALRAVLSDPSKLDAAFLVLSDLKAAASAENTPILSKHHDLPDPASLADIWASFPELNQPAKNRIQRNLVNRAKNLPKSQKQKEIGRRMVAVYPARLVREVVAQEQRLHPK